MTAPTLRVGIDSRIGIDIQDDISFDIVGEAVFGYFHAIGTDREVGGRRYEPSALLITVLTAPVSVWMSFTCAPAMAPPDES